MSAETQSQNRDLENIISKGESATVEFKRCGDGIRPDVWESACAFLNRFGGDIYLGIEDDGSVAGIPRNRVQDTVNNAINCAGNPNMFQPPFRLDPEVVLIQGKHVVRLHISASPSVSRYKREIYDRRGTADVHVFNDDEVFSLYVRKKNFAAEARVVPGVGLEDLRLDLMPQLRRMAVNTAAARPDAERHKHPWDTLSDKELLRSAGLIAKDPDSGKEGLVLAAILLLGKDDVIRETLPGYATDVIVKRFNQDRYDNRLVAATNLIESYEQIVSFAAAALPDKFFLEGIQRISLPGILVREMTANTLMHREFTSPMPSRFVIERDKMFVENPNRAMSDEQMTPDNFVPIAKNPIIASFFRNIGYADQLGSGVRNIFRRSLQYSGAAPVFQDGDMFRITVPLDDEFVPAENPAAASSSGIVSAPSAVDKATVVTNQSAAGTNHSTTETNQSTTKANYSMAEANQSAAGTNHSTAETNQLAAGTNHSTAGTNQSASGSDQGAAGTNQSDIATIKDIRLCILKGLAVSPTLTQAELAQNFGLNVSAVKYHVLELRRLGLIQHIGSRRRGRWQIDRQAVKGTYGITLPDPE